MWVWSVLFSDVNYEMAASKLTSNFVWDVTLSLEPKYSTYIAFKHINEINCFFIPSHFEAFKSNLNIPSQKIAKLPYKIPTMCMFES